jgi:hypothetical protein
MPAVVARRPGRARAREPAPARKTKGALASFKRAFQVTAQARQTYGVLRLFEFGAMFELVLRFVFEFEFML